MLTLRQVAHFCDATLAAIISVGAVNYTASPLTDDRGEANELTQS